MRLAIGKAADFSILAVHWAATFCSHLFGNEHPPSQPFQNPPEVNFAPLRSVGRNKAFFRLQSEALVMQNTRASTAVKCLATACVVFATLSLNHFRSQSEKRALSIVAIVLGVVVLASPC